MFGGFQVGAFQPLPAFQQESALTETASTGGYGWSSFEIAYERERNRRSIARKKRRELEEETEQIKETVDREIAELLRVQEAIDDRKSEIERLRTIATTLEQEQARIRYGERVAIALERAVRQGNFSAVEALERELERVRAEEEWWLVTATVLLLQ